MSVPAQTPISGPFIANGITTQFAYNFLLLDASDLIVFVGGSPASDFTVTGVGNSQGGNVIFNTPPASGLDVLIKRSTPYTRQTDYADNGDLLADVLNGDFDRLWLALQEIFANFSSSISKPVGGNWNAQGLRITTVADGIQPQDVVTVNQLNIVNGSAAQSAQAAAASAVAAALSELNAHNSETAAKTSETNARASEVNAKASENAAKTSETNAKASENAAKTSETNAKTSETNAADSAVSAKNDADRAQSANPDNQLKKLQNLADLPDKSVARDNLGLDSKSFIRGLNLSVAGTTVSVSAGSAATPSTGEIITVSQSGITATIGTTTAGTWYHIYLYKNSGGVATVEISTTPPVAYSYPAHNKTGDLTRRYLGSFRVDASNVVRGQDSINGHTSLRGDWGSLGRVLSNGVSASRTAVSVNTLVPDTATHVMVAATSTASGGVATIANASDSTGDLTNIPAGGKFIFSSIVLRSFMNIYYYFVTAATGGGLFIDVGGYDYAR